MRMLLVLLFVASVGLAGCSSHAGKQVSNVTLDQFVKGRTTKAEVLALLGPPQGNVQTPGGEALHYVFTKSGMNGATFLPIVGAFASKVTTETELVTLHFDKTGVYQDYFRGVSAITAGPGAN